MPARQPARTTGRFSQHLSGPIGGNRHSGPFVEFPLDFASMRNYYAYKEDFLDNGSYTANATDWVVIDINTATAPTQTLSIVEPYGVLALFAGTKDQSGSQVSRATSGGSNAAWGVQLTAGRRYAMGCRFKITETGTANESAMLFGFQRDDDAKLSSAGAIQGTTGQLGIYKTISAATLSAYTRNVTTATTAIGSSITPGSYSTVEFAFDYLASPTLAMDVWVDGVWKVTHNAAGTTSYPLADMYAPFFTIVNGTGADALLDIDYFWVMSSRLS